MFMQLTFGVLQHVNQQTNKTKKHPSWVLFLFQKRKEKINMKNAILTAAGVIGSIIASFFD